MPFPKKVPPGHGAQEDKQRSLSCHFAFFPSLSLILIFPIA